jgi:DUF1009 family protein
MGKLGLIAAGGALPVEIARACGIADRPLTVVRLKGFADPALAEYSGFEAGVAEFGKIFKGLKKEGCRSVCFVGVLPRPDFAKLRPDLRGLASLPGAMAAAGKGDDALIRFVLGEFEREGFVVEGAHQVVADLAIGEGPLGAYAPRTEDMADIAQAMTVARAIGRLDIGQAAVIVRGLTLAVEAQEGTDAMLRRCAQLPAALRGSDDALAGVLAKAPKPIQDRRVDLPTIGEATIIAAARAGLAGVVGEIGGLLIVDRPAVIRTADELGLFIMGVPPEATETGTS